MLSTLFRSGALTGLGDSELLECFAARLGETDEAAELACATLVARHGPMVMRVCRAVLGDRHEAEDAFQATFLVLASRATSIKSGNTVASWLHGVAMRVAANARSKAIRRRRHEPALAKNTTPAHADHGETLMADQEQDRALHEEIARLPDRLRTVVVLCYLEGLTHEQAAVQFSCPVNTVRSRLATARRRLRGRLARRGLGTAATDSLAGSVPPVAIPGALAEATVRGALCMNLGKTSLAAAVSTEAIGLAQSALTTMAASKLASVAAIVAVAGLAVGGLGFAGYSATRRDRAEEAKQRAGAGVDERQTNFVKEISSVAVTNTKAWPTAEGPRSADDVQTVSLQEAEQFVQSVIRVGEEARHAYGSAQVMAASNGERQVSGSRFARQLASYTGMLLNEAECRPGTPVAEQALIWIVKNVGRGAMADRAIDLIVRDHIQSEQIEPLFHNQLLALIESSSVERLMREAMSKNPRREIKARACFYLARYLEVKACWVPGNPSGTPRGRIDRQSTPGEHPRIDYIRPADQPTSQALEREAAALYDRLVTGFGDLQCPEPPLITDSNRMQPLGNPTYAVIARERHDEIDRLGFGRRPPEIDGLDLDGKPMKLSDCRGKVVALYFGGLTPPSSHPGMQETPILETLQKAAGRHAADSFCVLGVVTKTPGRSVGREAYRAALKASGVHVPFWWDFNPDGTPGPIQTAWNTADQITVYLLDQHGTISFKKRLQRDRLETAIAELVAEREAHPAPASKRR